MFKKYLISFILFLSKHLTSKAAVLSSGLQSALQSLHLNEEVSVSITFSEVSYLFSQI